MVETNWIPENPIGIKLPFAHALFPDVDWSMGGFKEEFSMSKHEPIKLGLYAWVVYGVLIVCHWSYYSDRFYYEYTMSEYGSMHLTFRTWYGVATYIRDLTKAFSWGAAGFFWAISLVPSGLTFMWFANAVTYLLMIETFVVFLEAMMKVFATFAYSDQYEIGHQNHTPYSKLNYAIGQFTTWNTSRNLGEDLAWTDLVLQALSLTLQFIAYPMVQYGAQEGVAKVQVINKKKAAIQRKANGNAGHPFWERNPWKNTSVKVGEAGEI